jgi:hypothetical protein
MFSKPAVVKATLATKHVQKINSQKIYAAKKSKEVKKKKKAPQMNLFKEVHEAITEIDTYNLLCDHQCECKSNKSKNCFMNSFVKPNLMPDTDRMCSFVHEGRQLTEHFDRNEAREFVRIEMMRTQVCSSTDNNYEIVDKDGVARKLCRSCWAFYHGVRVEWVKEVSKHLRSKGENEMKSSLQFGSHAYEDSTFFADVSFDEAESVFENWGNAAAGMLLYLVFIL